MHASRRTAGPGLDQAHRHHRPRNHRRALVPRAGAGVKIDMVVCGICGRRAGVAGLREHPRRIGRFLEHSRIVCFGNGQLPSGARVYISSADWMSGT